MRSGNGSTVERPGKARFLDLWRRAGGQRWKVFVFLLLVAYFVWLDQHVKVRPDHAFLIFLIVVLVLREAKAFLRDWSPFIGAWIVYDMMRGIADDLRPRVCVEGLYRLEVSLFGWLTGGEAPPLYSIVFQEKYRDSFFKSFLDVFCSSCYAMHMGAVLMVAWVLWHLTRYRALFYRFAIAFTIMNLLGFSTFLAIPTAPPWYVAEYGFVQPPAEFKGHGAGSLVNFDERIGFPLFENLYKRMNPNRFAAFPSLHAGYALFVFVFLLKRFGKKALPAATYPLGVSIGAVYLVHHYVVDVVAGWIYAGLAIVATNRLVWPWVQRFLPVGEKAEARSRA